MSASTSPALPTSAGSRAPPRAATPPGCTGSTSTRAGRSRSDGSATAHARSPASQPSRISRSRTSGWVVSATHPDPVPQHAHPLDLELDDVAGLKPPAVAVLQDAAGADRPRPEDVPGQERGVAGRVGDHRLPRVVHVGEVAARALLTVDAGDHRRAGAVELVRRNDDRAQAGRKVLPL